MIQSVIITEEAYKQMFQYVIEYANPNRPYRQWREVIGWLIGTIEGETATVVRAIPMTSGNSIFVEMTDYTIIPKIAEEAEKTNAVIVGWFHSHPSFGFFLSGIDIRTQRYQQSLFENAIALVCDPTKISLIEPGIHGYQVYMEHGQGSEYRELDIAVQEKESYPNVLEQLLLDAGINRSYSDVIAYEDLAALYALEGISPPHMALAQATDLLPEEREALPQIEVSYDITSPLYFRKESYLQVKISNIGQGIAYLVDMAIPPSYEFKMISMYPRRIIDQLNYDSIILETFKIKPTRENEIILPSIAVHYRTVKQRKYQVIVPATRVKVK
ncbi:MAG: Mov34/MPN/PAD-1 family protein [Candidatus Heimdallarchaeota archaeon]|nr:Mov34/MPN/PAD-1 family protein [Candidatus Heimdallarchaeota archaeon]